MIQETPYQISDVAEQADVSLRTVRFYQQEGLIAPSLRTPSGMRLYCESDVNRVKLVRRLKNCGMSLEDIKALLDSGEENSRKAMVEKTLRILQIEEEQNRKRIDEPKKQDKERAEIVKLVEKCLSCDFQTCPAECIPRTQIIQ